MGYWNISDDGVNVELAGNAHALWKALNPQHAPIFGRWVRAHRGNRLSERVDTLAKEGLKVEGPRRSVFWKDVAAAVAAMGKANAAIRPHLIDLPIEELYKVIIDAHQSVVEAVLPQLPKAQPRKHWFKTYFMRLIDRRNEARQRGASEDEIILITREIKRACRNAKN